MSKCYICRINTKAIDSHHLHPQAYGGKDGPTVDMCSSCHRLVHSQSLAILSKKPREREFFPADQIERAKPIVMAIVKATIEARDNPNLNHPTTLMLKIPKRMKLFLHTLKVDANYTNLEAFCIDILKNYIRGKL